MVNEVLVDPDTDDASTLTVVEGDANGDSIRLWCVNWSDLVENKRNFTDNFSISLSPKEHTDWL